MALAIRTQPVPTRPPSNGEHARAHRLVHTYGSDTLAYFALRSDKSYFFSSDGEAMIAYTRVGRYVLASGDPVGHPACIDRVIREFLTMCHEHGWRCAFLAVRDDDAHRYTSLGLRTFYLGEEAIIDCAEFRLQGKRNKSMRQSVQRVARTHRFEMLAETSASPALVSQLNEISRRWRGKAPERGFTMALGQAVEGTNPDYQLCVALDEHGVPGGFLRLVPLFGGEPGMTLDMMRRDPDAPNGMTEFLVANTAFALRDLGVFQLSMNFAVMGRLWSQDGAFTPGERLLKAVVSKGNRYFQLQSLHDFSRRFRPIWRPRVIVYEEQWSLPRIALLYGAVEGFLPLRLLDRSFARQRFGIAAPAALGAAAMAP
jgi:lysyl-tRNA synthetase class 2